MKKYIVYSGQYYGREHELVKRIGNILTVRRGEYQIVVHISDAEEVK